MKKLNANLALVVVVLFVIGALLLNLWAWVDFLFNDQTDLDRTDLLGGLAILVLGSIIGWVVVKFTQFIAKD
ncbi:hypothetical protein [Pelagerythrobacter aerophilus]|uniref:Uncharacterized protein n=1 Tax=Pelagerythrobacter aerophilus TaxID=2306995 RepID=A0A418NHN4_9SPHN|nr:hypothetical protein [Pelagerythrobacter aerophilus]RIV78116.1 hypothetical protein D2V04_09570 [Pelagerythrobacter aerophilus]